MSSEFMRVHIKTKFLDELYQGNNHPDVMGA